VPTDARPELAELTIADSPERWETLGFAIEDGVCELGGVSLRLGAGGQGIGSWSIRNITPTHAIDGLSTTPVASAPKRNRGEHPNGAIGIDHVVVITPAFDRTALALDGAGMTLRRIRDAGGFRQGFRRLGPAILELVEANTGATGPATFWGLVVIVEDLDALADRLGERLGRARAAVQPGRRIATLRPSAGLTAAVAFMTPARG
jgi:hypothetical protein